MPLAPEPRPCRKVLEDLQGLAGYGACDADSLADLPSGPGAYLLLIHLTAPLPLRIRTLPPAVLSPGDYVYAGSAGGPGGIRARVGRHLRRDKRLHWHVDRLTEMAACWAFAVRGEQECDLVRALLAQSGYEVALAGFGSSDCKHCSSHLLSAPRE